MEVPVPVAAEDVLVVLEVVVVVGTEVLVVQSLVILHSLAVVVVVGLDVDVAVPVATVVVAPTLGGYLMPLLGQVDESPTMAAGTKSSLSRGPFTKKP